MMFSKQLLSTEWTFKDRDDESLDAWIPVKAVPSTVQQDLIANKRLGVRKAQYHWGWDWGPIIMTAGIWREVRLEFYRLALDHKMATITADILIPADQTAQSSFEVTNPELWWPHGYGPQTLYDVISAERYRKWIELMVVEGQVMTRVWGGGIYEDDAFYDACDELGVLVWQDFMFGCGNYLRLRHHPSIVIYVGNNEDYQAQEQSGLTYNHEDKDSESCCFQNWYPSTRGVLSTIREAHGATEKPRAILLWGTSINGMVVWHGTQEKYQIFDTLGGRFNSEFEMECFPHMSTIEYFLESEKDKHPQSQVMDFHNKADGHERRLATYIVENLRMATDLEVIQADTMMFGYGGWRRQWGDERKCGGALLWQINDCWPTISWAIVDYLLRPKHAYYTVKRVMQPMVIGVRREHHNWNVVHAVPPTKSRYEMWVASSRHEVLHGTVELRFLSVVTGRDLRLPGVFTDVTIGANGTSDIMSGIIDHVTQLEPHVLAARLWIDGQIVVRDIDWPQPLKYLGFADRGLERTEAGECLVFEERENVRISDSAIDIILGDEQVVEVTGLSDGDLPLGYRYLGQ
ncbi:Glycoside hydrolase family 2 immunoglobulin-like beta-sandwich [Penicillium robsamsonii]|uniref:Glycoside hydrolase family 2 immunoglobulin-like beta-sandwich n=1 Tax=Penicillium robsamsonii TaxID=1792511 RepID=UPI0025492336|nr:Glycoside hydrolase family 2 immunoglobulin-like beta-sandwich [Penicillium robsamsonii]KAJ5827309.1 Glycoside hydrolase family 2 immunoglobulin-like beta-sandwich [Penicillium robsamsonii]